MIRLASIAARFKHGGVGGFNLGRSWTGFESLTSAQRTILRDRHGRWIRVHPDDRVELERFGLRFVNGIDPLAELKPTDTKKAEKADDKSTEKTNTKPKAEKADEKKAG